MWRSDYIVVLLKGLYPSSFKAEARMVFSREACSRTEVQLVFSSSKKLPHCTIVTNAEKLHYFMLLWLFLCGCSYYIRDRYSMF